MRRGFTILELLVASLLLSMLVTMLSMMFNQSSIAWRTGVAGVVELDKVREKMGTYHEIEDEALPGIGSGGGKGDNRSITYRNISLLRDYKGSGNFISPTGDNRAIERIDWDQAPVIQCADAKEGKSVSIGSSRSGRSLGAIVVGVRSAGPDRQWDTDDDITNWPEEID